MDFPSTVYCRKEHALRCGCHGNHKKITLVVIFSIIYVKRIEKSKITKRISIGLLAIFFIMMEILKTRTHTEKEELSYEKKFHEKSSGRNAYCSNGVFPYCMWRW